MSELISTDTNKFYDLIRKKNKTPKDSEWQATEYLKCKQSPFYFIYKYVHIGVTGGTIKVTPDVLNKKIKRTIRLLMRHHRCIIMASRQLGKMICPLT